MNFILSRGGLELIIPLKLILTEKTDTMRRIPLLFSRRPVSASGIVRLCICFRSPADNEVQVDLVPCILPNNEIVSGPSAAGSPLYKTIIQ